MFFGKSKEGFRMNPEGKGFHSESGQNRHGLKIMHKVFIHKEISDTTSI